MREDAWPTWTVLINLALQHLVHIHPGTAGKRWIEKTKDHRVDRIKTASFLLQIESLLVEEKAFLFPPPISPYQTRVRTDVHRVMV